MNQQPLVSVIIIFFNAEKFLAEAIDSVISQTYRNWELLLVDDGSLDGSRAIAEWYAELHPQQVCMLEHPGNENRGMPVARNLGIKYAEGEYLAFLDADDLWLPHKLQEQVAVMEAHDDASMSYGGILYWFSWTGEPDDVYRDHIPAVRVPFSTPIVPPTLLPLFLRGKAPVPCPTSIMVRRSLMDAIGGFDESFVGVHSIYEDQAFYAKVCTTAPVIAVDRCWEKYRQHEQASTAVAWQRGLELVARLYYLQWLEEYLMEMGIDDAEVWQALRREQWRVRLPAWLLASRRLWRRVFWVKKWVLRVEEQLLPATVSRRLWGV